MSYSLGELIKRLEAADQGRIVPQGFSSPHSYRGYYEDVSFLPARNVTVASMLEWARSAMGSTFEGYKGGHFTMHEYSQCWISHYGKCSGQTIGELLLDYMLGENM